MGKESREQAHMLTTTNTKLSTDLDHPIPLIIYTV